MNDKILVIIPTHNRESYLKRIVDYYDDFLDEIDIMIIDSSGKVNEYMDSHTDICYLHFPNEPFIDKLKKAMVTVKKQNNIYATFVADDDFFIVEKLIEYRMFLQNNPDYSAIQGGHVSFWQEDERHILYIAHQYAMNDKYKINQDNIEERVKYYFHNYFNVFYALTKKSLITDFFENVLPNLHKILNCDVYIDLIEVSQACFMILSGKIHIDKSIAMYREFIPNSGAHTEMVRISQLVAEQKLSTWKQEFANLTSINTNLPKKQLSTLLDIAMVGIKEFQDNGDNGYRKNLRRIYHGNEMEHVKGQWLHINKYINAKITSF